MVVDGSVNGMLLWCFWSTCGMSINGSVRDDVFVDGGFDRTLWWRFWGTFGVVVNRGVRDAWKVVYRIILSVVGW
jgi:hypothetical protein